MSYSTLPKQLQEKAREVLNENPTRTPSDLSHLREWIAKQPHLIAKTDDKSLLNFLRYAKFSLERAKEKIDAYYSSRSVMRDVFENRDPFSPEMQEILNRGMMSIIEDNSNPELPMALFINWKNGDPEKVIIQTYTKLTLMMCAIIMNKGNGAIINGFHVLIDHKGLSINYLPQLSPVAVKKLIESYQEGYPLRLSGLHLINLPAFAEGVFSLIKLLMKEKMAKRTHWYSKNYLTSLNQNVPPSLIPNEYGGTAGSIDKIAGETKKLVESYRDWFIEDSKYGTDETKRVGKSKVEEEFCLEGSFRNLTID